VNDVNIPAGIVRHKLSIARTFDHNKKLMNNLLYLIAVILLICWAIGFFAYSTGGIIHTLLVIAVIAVLLQVIRGRRI
jgi:predicted ferric reductase